MVMEFTAAGQLRNYTVFPFNLSQFIGKNLKHDKSIKQFEFYKDWKSNIRCVRNPEIRTRNLLTMIRFSSYLSGPVSDNIYVRLITLRIFSSSSLTASSIICNSSVKG